MPQLGRVKQILETLAPQLFLVVQLATPDTAQIQPPRSSSDQDGDTTDEATHPCRLGHHPEPVVRELSRERTGNAMQQTSLPSDSRTDANGAVLFADESWPDHLPPTPASQRVLDRVRIALAEEDCLTARCQRWFGDG